MRIRDWTAARLLTDLSFLLCTATGVLSDAKAIGELVRRVSPGTLVILDGVCSLASEEIRMDEWGIDAVSSKPLGALLVCTRSLMALHCTLGPCCITKRSLLPRRNLGHSLVSRRFKATRDSKGQSHLVLCLLQALVADYASL